MSTSAPISKKSVAIIGAGPGGLVAAQKLLRTNALSVTIFDKQSRVGGLWERDNLINPQMQTNFCMFTVAFSDLSWDSVDLGDGKPCPMYPRAWMVEKYLEVYKDRFLGEADWRLGTDVIKAERVDGYAGAREKNWRLTGVKKSDDEVGLVKTVEYYDYLLVATGYLSKPKNLTCEVEEMIQAPILHSTQYRNIEQLSPGSQPRGPPAKQRVLVVGGSHSGSEISTLIAFQASNARWSPFVVSTTPPAFDVVHITSHQVLAVPGFVRCPTSPSFSFQPMEYQLYERSLRGRGPLTHTFGLTNPEESIPTKMMIETQLSGEPTSPVNDLPAYVVVSDTYTRFVESNTIKPVVGQLKGLHAGPKDGEVTAMVEVSDGNMVFDGITAVINATGFDSCGSIDFLSSQVLEELGYDRASSRLPLVLDASYMAQRSCVPDIAVLGFTGVNWGVMEMQSRAIAAKWTSPFYCVSAESSKGIAAHIEMLRGVIKQGRKSEIPQVLFGDYLGLMEQAARELRVERVDLEFGPDMGMICAARYVDLGADVQEAEKQIRKLMTIQAQIQSTGLFLARAVFHGLNGKWVSKNGSGMEFHPRAPTNSEYELEYLVVETSAVGSKKWSVYRYDELHDTVSVWSISRSDNRTCDTLVYAMKFLRDMGGLDRNSCSAAVVRSPSAGFEIEPVTAYAFGFKGSQLQVFHIERETKDLGSATAEFTRSANIVGVTVGESFESGATKGQTVDKRFVPVETLAGAEEVASVPALKGNCCIRVDCIP